MSIAAQKFGSFCAEDLLAPGMPEKFVEIIEGELVAMTPAGWRHAEVAAEFHALFRKFIKRRKELAYGISEVGFLLRKDPDTLLCPDASLFRRRPQLQGPWLEFAPEIAVEVLSPFNSKTEIVYKTREYLKAGSEQVWIVDPDKRSIDLFFGDGRRITAQGDETLHGEGMAEGMEIPLAKLFRVS